jgi:hypothetical protein
VRAWSAITPYTRPTPIEFPIQPYTRPTPIEFPIQASKEQITEFFETMVSKDLSLRPDTPSPHLIKEAEELRAWIATMEDDGQWCLVATEL